MLARLLFAIGQSDCEEIQEGVLGQPINAVTSLAFSVVGIVIIAAATRVEGQERAVRIVFGFVMIATGLGSFLFHGPQPAASQFLHDITFLASLWFLAFMNLSDTSGWWHSLSWAGFGIGTGVLAGVILVFPASTNLLTGALLVVLVGSDILIHSRSGVIGWWYTTALLAMTVAVGLFVLGRTDSPLCDPDALWQGHGGWHVFAAVALGAYFMATSRARIDGRRGRLVAAE